MVEKDEVIIENLSYIFFFFLCSSIEKIITHSQIHIFKIHINKYKYIQITGIFTIK